MRGDDTMQDGGACCSNKDAASALSQNHPKSAPVKTAWNQKDRTAADGQSPAFDKGKHL